MNDPFRMPDWPIAPGWRYKQREGALDGLPRVPEHAQVSLLPSGQDKVEFFDVERPTSTFRLSKGDFLEIYDPSS